jgi:hypothetical protein
MTKTKAKQKTAKKNTGRAVKRQSKAQTPLVAKQPRSKQQAAIAAGKFLHADDTWSSSSYFDPDDLHCMDRELFG